MWLFDATPIGRIINRFSDDIFYLDNEVGKILAVFWNFLFRVGY